MVSSKILEIERHFQRLAVHFQNDVLFYGTNYLVSVYFIYLVKMVPKIPVIFSGRECMNLLHRLYLLILGLLLLAYSSVYDFQSEHRRQ